MTTSGAHRDPTDDTAELWQPGRTMPTEPSRRRVPEWLLQLFRRRTWVEVLWALAGLPLGIAGFVFTVVTLVVSGGLAITFVGLPLLAATGLASRWAAGRMRVAGNRWLGEQIASPPAFRRRPGPLGWVTASLADAASWRARLYLLLKLPVGILGFVVTVTFLAYGLAGTTYAIWRPFSGCNTTSHGACDRAVAVGPHVYADTPWRIVAVTVVGLLVLLLAPWPIRAAVALDRALVRSLLGPTQGSQRVAQLERTRANAVDDSAATLRRIERDLHDGAQATLVSLAMKVGLAREKLAEGGDPAQATALMDAAHTSAKAAIVELRDLARGIHPPVLDAGLDAALGTLAAHSAVPVEVSTAIGERPDPSIETMAYFCAAELLTNVAKHSGATKAWLEVSTSAGRLVVRVDDDGRGGARLGGGTGLPGLQGRIATVDGRMVVSSPDGGPTVVTVDLPLDAEGTR